MTKFIYNLQDLKNFFTEIKETDFKDGYTINFKKKSKRRSIPQNKLMWLYFACMEHETGSFQDTWHYYFRYKFLKLDESDIELKLNPYYLKDLINRIETFGIVDKSEIDFITKSTTELDTVQFTEYLKSIEIFAGTELNIKLPDPNDLQLESFIEHYSKM